MVLNCKKYVRFNLKEVSDISCVQLLDPFSQLIYRLFRCWYERPAVLYETKCPLFSFLLSFFFGYFSLRRGYHMVLKSYMGL